METNRVNRVEVIDDNGRSYGLFSASNVVVQLQDNDRTLKVFTNGIAIMRPPRPNAFDLKKAVALSDHKLSEAYRILMGAHWKMDWNEASKAREMRSILDGGTQPCVTFDRWVETVNFILEHLG